MVRSPSAHASRTRARFALPLAVLSGAALLAAVPIALLHGGCGAHADHLVASVERIDFGLVAHGPDFERRVTVKNEGRRSVVLTAVAPSCKCLVIDPGYRRSLQPEESTELVVRLVTAHVPPQKLEGKFVSVRSDDAVVPELRIPVIGEIETRIVTTPQQILVGAADAAGRGEPRRIKLRLAKGYTATVRKEVLRPDWFELKDEMQPDGSVDYLLTVKPDPARRGPVDTFVRFFVTVSGKGITPVDYEEKVLIQGTW